MAKQTNKAIGTVSVIGLGYIGLPTAALIANKGIRVEGVDVNPIVVETINRGSIHIVEPGLASLVARVVENGTLSACLHPKPAEVFIIAVPTPFRDGHHPDLSYIEEACRAIATVVKKDDIIILESTSPVGTTDYLSNYLSRLRPDLRWPQSVAGQYDVMMAYCPERVLPGKVIAELVANERVIGGLTMACSARAVTVYDQFVTGDKHVTDAKTAEMCKLTENSFRDVNIAFANELSVLCDRFGVNVWSLIKLANRHPRVSILQPGPGVGGHCIAVDPWFLVSQAPDAARLIETARHVNDSKPKWVLEKVRQCADTWATEAPLVIACFGLAFKANIDDLRESPSLGIVSAIAREEWGQVLVVEPYVDVLPHSLSSLYNVELTSSAEAIARATIIVLLVDHNEFLGLDWSRFIPSQVVDTRGMLRLDGLHTQTLEAE